MGFLNGAIMLGGFAAAGILSAILIRRRNGDQRVVLIPAISSLIGVPFLWATLSVTSITAMLGLATIFYFLLFMSRPAAFSLSIELAPLEHRGLATAIIVITTALIGGGGGPLLVGMISDNLTASMGNTESLRIALLTTVPIAMAICALAFFAVMYFIGQQNNANMAKSQ